MFDLKVIGSVLDQLEDERGIPKEKIVEAIEMALATAYKKEYGKKGQIIKVSFNPETGEAHFFQVKVVVDDDKAIHRSEDGTLPEDVKEKAEREEADTVIFNPEQHILLSDAKKMKKDAEDGEEMTFELDDKGDYGRIASQTAKQVIIQKIREAEKNSVIDEYGKQKDEIVSGTVQRIERGNIFVDLGRATGLLPREEQIHSERFRQGERIRAYLINVEESPRGVFVKLSRSHPAFLKKLFESETPELASGAVEIKGIARESGSRSKVAVFAIDDHIDPVGALVGQRGVRVSTVMSELGGEKIDIIEWSDDPVRFIEDSLSPAQIINVSVDTENKQAVAEVAEDQQSLAIGKSGQNVRLAAKLTGYRIDIRSTKGENVAEADSEGVEIINDEPEAEPEQDTEESTKKDTEVSEESTDVTEDSSEGTDTEDVDDSKKEDETEKGDDTDENDESLESKESADDQDSQENSSEKEDLKK